MQGIGYTLATTRLASIALSIGDMFPRASIALSFGLVALEDLIPRVDSVVEDTKHWGCCHRWSVVVALLVVPEQVQRGVNNVVLSHTKAAIESFGNSLVAMTSNCTWHKWAQSNRWL